MMINLEDLLKDFQRRAQQQAGGEQQEGQPPQKSKRKSHRPVNIDLQDRGRRFWIVLLIVLAVIVAFCYWWFHPSLNIQSPDLWWFVAIFLCLPAYVVFRGLQRAHSSRKPSDEIDIDSNKKARRFKYLSRAPLAIIAIGIIGALLSATFFPLNAGRYASVLTTNEYTFATDFEQVNYKEIPVIDRDSAILLGNRAMGAIPDYVSQFEISDLYSQINYQDTPVRVSPLGYADFFKWVTNRNPGIPAYVMVDMTTQDVKIQRLGEAMKYTQSEPFFRNIDRYVQLRYPFHLFDQLSFEIDENGHPWWVCPAQKRTIGLFGGETIARVVLVDACSGQCQDMDVADVPQWVDRVFPADLLIRQYNWWGRYCNGWWNSFIGQAGVRQTTPGTDNDLGYNYIAKDDDVWVYTGVTSATADNSIIGFVLINQRTAESHYYAVAGATEESAMASAEGQVQNLHYISTFPILLNIDNQPTYFMALKDAAGLVKKYAMIDIQRYQNVAIGDTVSGCQTSYETLLASTGVLSHGDMPDSAAITAEGKVEHIATAVINGNTHVYLTLEEDKHIYDCALPDLLVVLQVKTGDKVSLIFAEGEPACKVTSLKIRSGDAKGEEATSAVTADDTGAEAATGDAQQAG